MHTHDKMIDTQLVFIDDIMIIPNTNVIAADIRYFIDDVSTFEIFSSFLRNTNTN